MPTNPPNNPPLPSPEKGALAPCGALERPTGLKKWASELAKIVENEREAAFEGFDFADGKLTHADLGRILQKIRGCGSVVELRASLDRSTGEMGAPVVHAANFCGQHTICPVCAGRVQDRRGMRFRDPIERVANQFRHAYLITATTAPGETWREDLDGLIRAWQSFRRMGQKRKGRKSRSRGEWGKVGAAIAKIEIKRGEGSGLPHCHYHALIFTNERLDYSIWDPRDKNKPPEKRRLLHPVIPWKGNESGFIRASKLSWEWFRASKGTAVNIRVDSLRLTPNHKKRGMTYAQSIVEQSREVLKYATKFDTAPSRDQAVLFARDFVGIKQATYNRRLFSTYGAFREVEGDDYTGGGPHITERPAIFEARWRGDRYSDLSARDKPIFPNSDAGPGVSRRIQALNRCQGMTRRVRSAVFRSRDHFLKTGELVPAEFRRRKYWGCGWIQETPVTLEIPERVALAPGKIESWENWIDEITNQGRDAYNDLRDFLDMDGLESLNGTIEERSGTAAVMRRAWRNSDEYEKRVIEGFIRVLTMPPPSCEPVLPSHSSYPGASGQRPGFPCEADPADLY